MHVLPLQERIVWHIKLFHRYAASTKRHQCQHIQLTHACAASTSENCVAQKALTQICCLDKSTSVPAHSAHPCMCCLAKNTYVLENNLFSCQYSQLLLKSFDNDFVPCCLQKEVFKTLWCDERTEWWKRDNCNAIYVLQWTYYWETTLVNDCIFHFKM